MLIYVQISDKTYTYELKMYLILVDAYKYCTSLILIQEYLIDTW